MDSDNPTIMTRQYQPSLTDFKVLLEMTQNYDICQKYYMSYRKELSRDGYYILHCLRMLRGGK